MGSFECPNCDTRIDRKYIFLKGAQGQYGIVKKKHENKDYLINRVLVNGDSSHFVFKKDSSGYTQKWSFRLRKPERVIKYSFNQLNKLEKILYTSEGVRFGVLVDQYPSDINSELVKYNLKQ